MTEFIYIPRNSSLVVKYCPLLIRIIPLCRDMKELLQPMKRKRGREQGAGGRTP